MRRQTRTGGEGPRPVGSRGGDLRLRRAERRRQDHHHQDADGAHLPHLGQRHHLRRAHPVSWRRSADRLPAGEPRLLRFPHRTGGHALLRVPVRAWLPGGSTPGWRSCSRRSASPTRPTGRSGSTRRGCSSGSGSPRPWPGDPAFVVLDEPMSGLDPIGRKEVRDLILELKRRGKTVFFSTHILPDVESLCDRVGVILGGRLRDVGRISDLLSPRVRSVEVVLDVPEGARERVGSGRLVSRDGIGERSIFADLGSANAAVAAVLAAGGALVSLVPHRETLEDFFLRRLRGGQGRRRGGPRAGGRVTAFPEPLRWLVASWSFAAGAVVGSFLNVVIARVPAGESIVRPRSRCPSCRTPIAWYDNVPVLSWLAAPGALPRLPHPHRLALPARRAPRGRSGAGLGVGATASSLAALAEFAFAATLLALAFIDLDTWLLPHVITLPLLGAGLVLSALHLTARRVHPRLGRWSGGGLGRLRAGGLPRGEDPEEGGPGLRRRVAARPPSVAWLGVAALLPVVLLASLQGTLVGLALILAGPEPARPGGRRDVAPEDAEADWVPPAPRRAVRPLPRPGRAGVALAPGPDHRRSSLASRSSGEP